MADAFRQRNNAPRFVKARGVAAEPSRKSTSGAEAQDIYRSVLSASCPTSSIKEEEPESFCATCSKFFNSTQLLHDSSLSHLLARDRESELKLDPFYAVAGPGRDLLIKSGWIDHSKGLGKSEQGRLAPVKSIEKHDHLGIGLQKVANVKHKSHPATLSKRQIIRKAAADKAQWIEAYRYMNE